MVQLARQALGQLHTTTQPRLDRPQALLYAAGWCSCAQDGRDKKPMCSSNFSSSVSGRLLKPAKHLAAGLRLAAAAAAQGPGPP